MAKSLESGSPTGEEPMLTVQLQVSVFIICASESTCCNRQEFVWYRAIQSSRSTQLKHWHDSIPNLPVKHEYFLQRAINWPTQWPDVKRRLSLIC